MVGRKIPKVPIVSCTCNSARHLRLFCCSRKRAWKMVDNPKVKPLGVVAGFFPQWHGCQKRIDNLSEEMLKFPSSKNKKGLPNTRVKTTSFAELSPFEFKRRSKNISFDTCLALKTDYFGLQNGWTAHLTVCGGSGHVFISFGTLGSLQWHWHWTSAVQHWDDIYCIYIMYWCGMCIYIFHM